MKKILFILIIFCLVQNRTAEVNLNQEKPYFATITVSDLFGSYSLVKSGSVSQETSAGNSTIGAMLGWLAVDPLYIFAHPSIGVSLANLKMSLFDIVSAGVNFDFSAGFISQTRFLFLGGEVSLFRYFYSAVNVGSGPVESNDSYSLGKTHI